MSSPATIVKPCNRFMFAGTEQHPVCVQTQQTVDVMIISEPIVGYLCKYVQRSHKNMTKGKNNNILIS